MDRARMSLIAGALLLFPFYTAQAVEEQRAPLVFEYTRQGPAAIDSPVTVTSGTITAISCSWESDGEVRLEVSANGGGSYTRVVNGRPLEEGFLPGNRLCFRAALGADSSLRTVTLGYRDSSGADRMYRGAWGEFKYKKAIGITGTGEELFDWPVKIQIGTDLYAGKGISGNFRDVRFAAADGESGLSYYLERVDLRNGLAVSADFWVRIPQLPAEGGQVYVYYGNSRASDGSDGDKVFPFFDDFNGRELDTGKWELKAGLDKECSLSDGWLELGDCSVISRQFRIRKGIIEFKAKADKGAAIQAVVRGAMSAHGAYPMEQLVYSSAYPGAEHAIAVNDVAKLNTGSPIKPLAEYIYRASLNQSEIVFERFSGSYEKEAEIRFLNMDSSDTGYIGLRAGADLLEKGSAYFDWIRVRPYAESEPAAILNLKRE